MDITDYKIPIYQQYTKAAKQVVLSPAVALLSTLRHVPSLPYALHISTEQKDVICEQNVPLQLHTYFEFASAFCLEFLTTLIPLIETNLFSSATVGPWAAVCITMSELS